MEREGDARKLETRTGEQLRKRKRLHRGFQKGNQKGRLLARGVDLYLLR